MKTSNFQNLIQQVTNRNFIIETNDIDLINDKKYKVYRVLPLTKSKVSFEWKVAKNDENILKSFITTFCNKYREPNPAAYNYVYGGISYKWDEKTDIEKEYCFVHHQSRMLNKEALMRQVQDNFNLPNIETAILRYGFYTTEYGIGTFALFQTNFVVNAINKLKTFLNSQNIPFANEYSNKMWVYRFKLNLNKDTHTNILQSFTNY